MNRQTYLRRIARNARKRDRAAAVGASAREIDELKAEALAEGLSEAEAEVEAVRLHGTAGPRAWNPWRARALMAAPFQAATWLGAAYLVALFPLGLAAGIWATAGLALVVGLSLVGVGLLLAVPYLLSLRPIAQALGSLASWATGQPIPMLHTVPRAGGTLKARILARLQDPETLPAWIACLVAFVTGQIAIAWIAGLGSAVVYLVGSTFLSVPPMPGGGAIYPDWLVANPVAKLAMGIPLLWMWAWGCQAMAWTFARITRTVLARS